MRCVRKSGDLGEPDDMIDWRKNAPALRPPSTPDGTRIYGIGDIHGCLETMEALLRVIADDMAHQPAQQTIGVFLGDYVDRGFKSYGVLERLTATAAPMDFVALRGNHESMLLRFLKEPAYLEEWRSFGGLETLHSYGIDVSAIMRGTGYEEAHDAFATKFPEA